MKRTVIITEKKEKGLIRKRTVYDGVIKGAPGVSGKSTNNTLNQIYHSGDEVTADVMIYIKNQDEYMTFEILEE